MSRLSFLHFNMLAKMHVMEKTAVGVKVQEGNEKMKEGKKKEKGNPNFKLGNSHSEVKTSKFFFFFFFFFNRHCNPCGLWPAQLSLSILSTNVLTECHCQWHVKPPTSD